MAVVVAVAAEACLRALRLLRRRLLQETAHVPLGPLLLRSGGLQKPLQNGCRRGDVLAWPFEVGQTIVVLHHPAADVPRPSAHRIPWLGCTQAHAGGPLATALARGGAAQAPAAVHATGRAYPTGRPECGGTCLVSSRGLAPVPRLGEGQLVAIEAVAWPLRPPWRPAPASAMKHSLEGCVFPVLPASLWNDPLSQKSSSSEVDVSMYSTTPTSSFFVVTR